MSSLMPLGGIIKKSELGFDTPRHPPQKGSPLSSRQKTSNERSQIEDSIEYKVFEAAKFNLNNPHSNTPNYKCSSPTSPQIRKNSDVIVLPRNNKTWTHLDTNQIIQGLSLSPRGGVCKSSEKSDSWKESLVSLFFDPKTLQPKNEVLDCANDFWKSLGSSSQPNKKQCPSNVKKAFKRIETLHQLTTVGIEWKAPSTNTLRANSLDQLWRGIMRFDSLSINDVPISIPGEDCYAGFDETKKYASKDVPNGVLTYYKNIFEELRCQGLPFPGNDSSVALEQLLQLQTKEVRNIYKLLLLMNMDGVGVGALFFREKCPLLFREDANYNAYGSSSSSSTLKTRHNRKGKMAGLGVNNAAICNITVSPKTPATVTHEWLYLTAIKASGFEMINDKPIATYKVTWEMTLPKSKEKFSGRLKVSGFEWDADATEEDKRLFREAFFDIESFM